MNQHVILKSANASMLITFIAFFVSVVLSYGYESTFPLWVVTILHVSQMILAGMFKVSYVVRLVAQKQLGMAIS